MKAIFKRELKSYFTGMMGYVFIAFVLLFLGIYTSALNLKYGYPGFEYVVNSSSFMFLIAVPVMLTLRRRPGAKHQNPAEQVRARAADRVRMVKMQASVPASVAEAQAKPEEGAP